MGPEESHKVLLVLRDSSFGSGEIRQERIVVVCREDSGTLHRSSVSQDCSPGEPSLCCWAAGGDAHMAEERGYLRDTPCLGKTLFYRVIRGSREMSYSMLGIQKEPTCRAETEMQA